MTTAVNLHFGAPAAATVEPDEPVHDRRVSAFDLLAGELWALPPAMLETMAAIARREGEPIEALESRLGRPLQNTRSVSIRDGVAIVPVVGPIFRYANLFTEVSGATSLSVLATDFAAALDNPQVDAVVLAIDSPGGQAAGIAEFAQLIRRANKPVIAYADNLAASAAYWIGAAAQRLVLAKTAEVGSIGAVVTLDTASARAGQIVVVSSQSPNKRPDVSTSEGRAQIQARLDALAQVFVEDVAAYRGVSVDKVLSDFGRGDVLMGQAAVAAGMADEISTLEDVLAGLRAGTVTRARPRTTGGKTMTITRDTLAAEAPELLDALLAEARAQAQTEHAAALAQARAEGAEAERARIREVQAQTLPGHEQLVEQMAWDGHTTAAEAAVAVLKAERDLAGQRVAALAKDAPAPVRFAADDAVSGAVPTGSADQQAKAYADEIRRRQAAAQAAGRTLTPSQAMAQIKQEITQEALHG